MSRTTINIHTFQLTDILYLVMSHESMATATKGIIVHERSGVSPPFSAPEAAEHRLPLTFFDMVWLYFHPIQRLLFYQYPCSTTNFLETVVPNLKKSLSETLEHYYPLSGNLFRPLKSDDLPELRYSPGDSVAVTFAESGEAFDFDHLTGYQARDSDDFHAFVPNLPETKIDSESGFEIIPLLAIQVTLFSGAGICIAINNNHVLGDASSMVGFIKAWSKVSILGGSNDELLAENCPLFDRSVIKDPSGRRASLFWNQIRAFKLGSNHSKFPINKVRATYILQKNDIQILKNLVLAKDPGFVNLSSFIVTTAYVWSCLAKSAAESGEQIDDNESEYFGFSVDSRHRLEPPAPAAYFGNCLSFVVVESKHGQLKGEDGFFVAAELTGELITKKVNNREELLRDADEWLVKFGPLQGKRLFGVAGSPRFDLYDTDFGWGKPKKYESVSIDMDGSMCLCKSREFEGGLEIGMSLPKKKMDAFAVMFSDGLKI